MSFTKDIVLGVLIVILLATNSGKASKGIFGKIILYTVTLGTAAFQWYALTYLPIVDCLPYKKGNDIVEQMKVPVGAVPDSTSIEFMYTKNGKEVRFDQANFPSDFDSTYVYVDRKDIVVKKGNGLVAKIVDFSLQSVHGTDTTAAIFANQKPYVLVFAKEMKGAESWKNSSFNNFGFTTRARSPSCFDRHNSDCSDFDWIGARHSSKNDSECGCTNAIKQDVRCPI